MGRSKGKKENFLDTIFDSIQESETERILKKTCRLTDEVHVDNLPRMRNHKQQESSQSFLVNFALSTFTAVKAGLGGIRKQR